MVCEIINPSDAYTIDATNRAAACAATLLIGSGQYGLRGENGEDVMGIFIFGNSHEPFWEKEFGGKVEDYISTNKADVATALESVVIGNFSDRKLFLETVDALPKDKRGEWIDKWNDRKRSSMNNIGGRAKKYAEYLRTPESSE